MSRIYPERLRVGWMRRKEQYKYRIQTNDGTTRVWYPHMEREPLTGAPETPIEPGYAGYVLRDGVYVWGGRGMTRRKP